ncbi:MAG: TonB-dependent receptor plug domain-containing protein, partial [Arcobacter sp.]|uniref:TonB-dependent receptor plug domain-containing protein n=1 Tax=Arcobacter sp. TaxID=1872629 RepID=UPI003D002E92
MRIKSLFLFLSSSLILQANEYKFDLLDDIFDLDLEQLQQIKVNSASKYSQNLNFTPAKMIVITKEQIEQRGYRSIDELLNDLPAIQILNHADSGIMNQIGIRGIMGNNYFKILQDGIEINQTDGEIMSVSMQYPLFGIERVEILYGAASVIYGADAISGVINLISSTKVNGQAGI